MKKSFKTTIYLPESLQVQMKIMCALTHKRQSDFIRIALQEKIKELKIKMNLR